MLGKFGETQVMDWGLAKVVGRSPEIRRTSTEATLMPASGSGGSETQLGSALGTPQYMSPEQAAGRWDVVDPSTDIYSLGATLYTLLTGRTPFPKENWPALQQKIQRGTFPRPRQVSKETPAALEAICLKAMAMNPEDRYASATALATDVEHWLADEPVTAWREPATVKARRWLRRRRSLVAGLVGLLLAAVVALAVGTILLSAKQSEVEAERNAARRAAAQAEAINRFLTEDLLFEAAPERNPREKQVTVEAVLRKAAQRIESTPRFKNQPEIEASLRLVIGNTLFKLGDPKSAEPHLRRAVGLRRETLGPEDPATLTAQEDLATLLVVGLRMGPQAVPLCQTTWETRGRVLGANDPATLESLDTYCSALMLAGHVAEAERFRRQCLEAERQALGEKHPLTVMTLGNLGWQLAEVGRHVEAEPILKESLRLKLEIDGAKHPEILPVRNNLAKSQWYLGRFADAEATLKDALALSLELTGTDSYQTVHLQHMLTRALAGAGSLERAEQLGRDTLRKRREIVKPGSTHIGWSLTVLGQVLVPRGKSAEADQLLSEALGIFRNETNVEDWIAQAEVGRGTALASLGRFEEAEPLLAAAWPRLLADRRIPPWHKRQAAETIAKVYEQAGKAKEAEAWRARLPVQKP